MAETHALVTGPINGRIPIDHPKHPDGFVNVTDEVLYLEDLEHVQSVATAIEAEHRARGTHPDQAPAEEF